MNLFPSSYRGKCVSVSWNWDVGLHGLQGTNNAYCFVKNGTTGEWVTEQGIESAVVVG